MKRTSNYKHITTSKGDIGVAMVTADLIQQGVEVMTPISHTTPYDLVAYYEGSFYTVQVKYRLPNSRNALEVTPRRMKKQNMRQVYTQNNDFDILAVYTPESGCCYIHSTSYSTKTVTFRFKPPKNNQGIGVRLFSDYKNFSDAIPK